MAGAEEVSKKRNSFSILTWKDPTSSSKADTTEELANSKFIPESKRGWKYDLPFASPTRASAAPESSTATKTRASADLVGQSLGTSDLNVPPTSNDRGAVSAPVSPKRRTVAIDSRTADSSSDYSSGEEPGRSSSSSDELRAPAGEESVRDPDSHHNGPPAERHPDDLVYPDAYPWKPSRKDPSAKYINPALRNPTAKQAFYDTHFGSSSNYRGLTQASGSILSLNPIKTDAARRKSGDDRRRSSDRGNVLSGETEEGGTDRQDTGLISTIKKPLASASKLLTKATARRKSVSANAQPPGATTERNAESAPPNGQAASRPHPVPLLESGGEDLAAQRSGFSYGLSLEDAAQVEAVVSRQSTAHEALSSPTDLLEPPSTEVSSSRWRETMHSVWGFLPSFDFFASSSSSSEPAPSSSVNLLEAEAIPSVKKDAGSPNYYKNLSGNVVILGGYRGSVLRDAETNIMMWIPIKVGVGLRRPTLELGLSSAAEEHSEDLVYSSEMCTHIGKLVDMGKRLEERIAGRRHAKVYSWGYDWRLSLARSSRKLTAFLEELYEASTDASTGAKRGAKVVAHSMGGLVALHALATCKNPRIFEGLVFASTPFRGTPNILGPFRFGDAALFNDTICSPRATFSFRSSFYLLPTDKRCFEIPVGDPEQDEEELTEQQKKERFKDVDFLDPHVWNELGLSPCLEVGRRQEVLAIARKTGSRGEEGKAAGANDKGDLEKEAAYVVRSNSVHSRKDIDSVSSPKGEEGAGPYGLTMGLMEGLTDGSNAGTDQAEFHPEAEEQEQLQPENREGARRNSQSLPTTPTKPSSDPDELAFDQLDYSQQTWLYLERTLSEVRQFWADIENGFNPSFAADHSYPPLMIMTSGRTPCVRGALVGVDEAYNLGDDKTGQQGWKDDVRAGDYSRMTYAAGDGVITRRSATSLPGKWATLLAKREETETLPEELWGKGPPFKSIPEKGPGKARLKLDRYRMRFEGEGVVESAHRHVTLLSDVDGIGKCLEAVRRANFVRGRIPLTQSNSANI